MVKKFGLVAAGVFLLLGLVFGRETLSYVGTSFGLVRQKVADAVPIDFEINRARDLVKSLGPEIDHNKHVIAKEEVELKSLKEEIAKAEKTLSKNRGEIERLTNDLKRGDSNYSYAGVVYTSKQVESDLTRRFELYKDRDVFLDKKRELVAAREQRLAAAREKLRSMQAAREQLVVDIEHQDARLEMVKVAQTTSQFNFDDSAFGRTNELLKNIKTRISVAEKMVGSGSSGGQISLEEPEDSDITNRISEYFQKSKTADSTVVVKLEE
jgi:hypothetical protein